MSIYSLAEGSDEAYVGLQVRKSGNNSLHVQGKGVVTNRSYGVAVDLSAPSDLVEWLSAQQHTVLSLVSPGKYYVPIQARMYDNGVVHVQVAGSSYNRPYGAVFETSNEQLAEFVSNQSIDAYEEEPDYDDTEYDVTVL